LLLNLKPGTRLVSNTFTMSEWQSDQTVSVGGPNCSSWCTAHLWIVPAKVAGTWQLGKDELKLEQTFQMVTGTLKTGAGSAAVTGKLNGNQITFKAGETEYTGKVSGEAMEGANKAGNWKATRTSK
jgi:hypothetical protein